MKCLGEGATGKTWGGGIIIVIINIKTCASVRVMVSDRTNVPHELYMILIPINDWSAIMEDKLLP